jgi:DNA-directed RNA polymerase specialized sigma24 family protein
MPDAISQTHLDDDSLIANGLQGDQEAFNVLFSKYRRLLYGLASRVLHSHEEAEDACAKLLSPGFLQAPKFQAQRKNRLQNSQSPALPPR